MPLTHQPCGPTCTRSELVRKYYFCPHSNHAPNGTSKLMIPILCLCVVCTIWIIGLISSTGLFEAMVFVSDLEQNNSISVLKSAPSQPQQLLGILLVGKADVLLVHDWLVRHVAIFETLVAIDGTSNAYVQQQLSNYPNVIRIDERSLNLPHVNDQLLRAPAMEYFDKGNPIGRWIMICHADEFWMIDPRQIVHQVDPIQHNAIRMPVLTASPMESDYFQQVQQLQAQLSTSITATQESEPDVAYSNFHIMEVSKWAHNPNGTSELATRKYRETRFVHWEKGMAWGDRRAMVIPEHVPGGKYKTLHLNAATYVHFKLHDFAANALSGGFRFANSNLMTGVHNNSDEGWMGTFLDISFPKQLERYPPQLVQDAILEFCQTRAIRFVNCTLWSWGDPSEQFL